MGQLITLGPDDDVPAICAHGTWIIIAPVKNLGGGGCEDNYNPSAMGLLNRDRLKEHRKQILADAV
jgi:hypothetical protein